MNQQRDTGLEPCMWRGHPGLTTAPMAEAGQFTYLPTCHHSLRKRVGLSAVGSVQCRGMLFACLAPLVPHWKLLLHIMCMQVPCNPWRHKAPIILLYVIPTMAFQGICFVIGHFLTFYLLFYLTSSLAVYFASVPTVYLAFDRHIFRQSISGKNILTVYLACYLTLIWHSSWHTYILSLYLSFYLALNLAYNLTFYLACFLIVYLGLAVRVRRRTLRSCTCSGGRVRRGTLRSCTGSWGPAEDTLILSLLFGSSEGSLRSCACSGNALSLLFFGGEHCDILWSIDSMI